MKVTTCINLRRFSILAILFLLSTAILTAQVKIKEKVEISPRSSVHASVQSFDLTSGFSCTVPFSGPGTLYISGFDYIFDAEARLLMNGQTIIEDIYEYVFDTGDAQLNLGNFEQGAQLTFTMVNPSNGETILAAQECWSIENACSAAHSIIFTNVPICGQEFNWRFPKNIDLEIGFGNAEEYAKRILQPAWEGSIPFKDPTILQADYKSVCSQSFIDLPEGTTFTFTITQGQEHAILYDIYTGNEGASLSGIPGGAVRLKAIGDEPTQPVDVLVEANITVPGTNTCVFHMKILPNDLKVIPTKTVITYGDTLRFDVWKKLSATEYGPLESGMAYDYSIVEGSDASYLISPDGSQSNQYEIGGDFSSSIFAPFENTPQGNSTLVKLKATASMPAPPPPPCDDCNPDNIKPKNPVTVTNGPMLNRSASKINSAPQLTNTNSIPIEKNTGTSPNGTNNNTGTHTVPLGIGKPQLTNLHKNNDGSYSFVNRDTTGAMVSSKNADKVMKQQADNASQIVLRKNAYGGYSPEKINPITSKTVPGVASTQDEAVDGIQYGIVTIEVVKPSDILLGETKYYTAKPDPEQYSNLIISESSSPDLGDGDERVIFEDPKIADDAVNNDTVGVYWDYNKPDSTGLDNGVIRLYANHWKQDTIYKVKLHAVLKELGREGAIELVIKPGCIHAAFAKTPLCPGDTTDLIFTYANTGIPVPMDELLNISIDEANGYSGELLPSSGDTSAICTNVVPKIRYIAPNDITGDSQEIYINAIESDLDNSGSAKIKGGQASKPVISAKLNATNISIQNVSTSMIKAQDGNVTHPQTLSHAAFKELPLNACNNDAGPVEKHTILLGETKYYYAIKDDKNNLDIKETKDPTKLPLGGWLPDVSFDDPVAADGSEKNPVYWEDQRPTYDPNDGTFTGSETLPHGIIRLVGRFFDYEGGKIYKTKLTTNKPNEGKTTTIEIEVEKPVKLIDWDNITGNYKNEFKNNTIDYSTSTDVSGKPLSIDNLIIKLAGESGIPPQLVKAHMFKEAKKTGYQFNPCFRYEPWTDAIYQYAYNHNHGKNQFLDQPFVVTQSGMGLVNNIIPTHLGYNKEPISYPTTPQKIGQYVVDNWSIYFDDDNCVFNGVDNKDPKNDWWELEKNLYLDQYHYDLASACDSATQRIKDEIIKNRPEWAQTRKNTSYSIIQILYLTANDFGYNGDKSINNLNSWNRPEDLNDHTIAIPFYKNVTIRHLEDVIGNSLPVSNWADGYEATWVKVIQKYNSGETGYGSKVVNYSKFFEPQEK